MAAEARTFIGGVLGAAPDAPIRLVAVRRARVLERRNHPVRRRGASEAEGGFPNRTNIAEGVAKTWLGGSVFVTGDGNGAIREGLARYLATQFLESKYGKDVADVERLRQRVAYASVVQRDSR